MKRLTALGALAGLSLLAGCATGGGYYSGGYGYDGYGYDGYGGYPNYAYDYGYVPYYDDFGYPYGYGPALGLGFSYYDFGGHRGGFRDRGEHHFRGGERQHAGGFDRAHGPVASGGLGPQAVAPQGGARGGAVAPSGRRSGGLFGRRQG